MLVLYFGPTIAKPENGELGKTQTFFDAGLKLNYEFYLTSDISLELNSGVKNIFNSFQNDFDNGSSRKPAYIQGSTSTWVVYLVMEILR